MYEIVFWVYENTLCVYDNVNVNENRAASCRLWVNYFVVELRLRSLQEFKRV